MLGTYAGIERSHREIPTAASAGKYPWDHLPVHRDTIPLGLGEASWQYATPPPTQSAIPSSSQPVGNLTYGAETSPDLTSGSWQPVTDSGNANGFHTFAVPAGPAQKGFIRLMVSRP
jgi:hypothetical protein